MIRFSLMARFERRSVFQGRMRPRSSFCLPAGPLRVNELRRYPEAYDTRGRGVKLSGGEGGGSRRARAPGGTLVLRARKTALRLDSEWGEKSGGTESTDEGTHEFVIAHRLSTIRRADQFLVVEQGAAIVERGKVRRGATRARRALYDLYTRQHGLEANLFLAPGEGGCGAGVMNEEKSITVSGDLAVSQLGFVAASLPRQMAA